MSKPEHSEMEFFLFIYLFYFWLHCVFVAVHGLSLVAASGGYSSLWYVGFSLWWLLLLLSTGSRHAGFSSCGMCVQQLRLAGSRAEAQQLWHTDFVAPQHVGSSQIRARAHVPCIGRRILNHCTTREVPDSKDAMVETSLYIQLTQVCVCVCASVRKRTNHKNF